MPRQIYWLAVLAVCWMLGIGWAHAETAPWLTPEATRARMIVEISDAKLCREWLNAVFGPEAFTKGEVDIRPCLVNLGHFGRLTDPEAN